MMVDRVNSSNEPAWAREPPALRENLVVPGEPSPASSAPPAETPPSRKQAFSKVLCFFRFLTVVTILLAVVVAAVNAYIIYKDYESLGVRGILLRVYGIMFSFFVILSELEWKRFTAVFGFLENWVARGVAYAFVGLITWDQTSESSSGSSSSATTYSSDYDDAEDVVAFMMMGVGVVYIILGMACMRTVKEAELGEGPEADDLQKA
ncbi:unnamed protein product [Phaeothamnion confervicola]